jgi:hypothetical protein
MSKEKMVQHFSKKAQNLKNKAGHNQIECLDILSPAQLSPNTKSSDPVPNKTGQLIFWSNGIVQKQYQSPHFNVVAHTLVLVMSSRHLFLLGDDIDFLVVMAMLEQRLNQLLPHHHHYCVVHLEIHPRHPNRCLF